MRPPRRRPPAGAWLLLAAMSVVGCGDGDLVTTPDRPGTDTADGAVGEAGPTGDACGFLSPEAIERVTGTSSDTGRLDDQVSSDRHGVCTFDLADGGSVQVVIEHGGDASQHRATTEALGEVATEDVDELPGGYHVPDIGFVGAQAGSDYAQVALQPATGEPSRELLVALMQEILTPR